MGSVRELVCTFFEFFGSLEVLGDTAAELGNALLRLDSSVRQSLCPGREVVSSLV